LRHPDRVTEPRDVIHGIGQVRDHVLEVRVLEEPSPPLCASIDGAGPPRAEPSRLEIAARLDSEHDVEDPVCHDGERDDRGPEGEGSGSPGRRQRREGDGAAIAFRARPCGGAINPSIQRGR
jgi:hypothetical protein